MSAVWNLPFPSMEIETGPRVEQSPGSLRLTVENEDGERISLLFPTPAYLEFRGVHACAKGHVEAYDKLVDLGSTELLRSLQRPDNSLVHYRIFFDDIGSYEVVSPGFSAEVTRHGAKGDH